MSTTVVECATHTITLRHPKHIDLNGDEFEVPTFTMKQIYDAIPKHCFKRSTAHSISFVFRDFAYLSTLIYVTYNLTPMIPNMVLRGVVYMAQVILSGMIMTGIWIVAHECGHRAFSESKTVNNTVGYILHTLLLVPFHSWRITHSHHHKNTGNLSRETVFLPHDRESWVKRYAGEEIDPHTISFGELAEDAPILHLCKLVLHQVLGWPGYMLFNLSGQPEKTGFPQHSHYWFGVDSAMFKEAELSLVLQSDVGIAFMTWAIYKVAQAYGWWSVSVFYVLPYLSLNHWIGESDFQYLNAC